MDLTASGAVIIMPVFHPVLLCGGSGTRLWPLSRKSYPKQFVELTGEGTPEPARVRDERRIGHAGLALQHLADLIGVGHLRDPLR